MAQTPLIDHARELSTTARARLESGDCFDALNTLLAAKYSLGRAARQHRSTAFQRTLNHVETTKMRLMQRCYVRTQRPKGWKW
jgi:hypothetical protein